MELLLFNDWINDLWLNSITYMTWLLFNDWINDLWLISITYDLIIV